MGTPSSTRHTPFYLPGDLGVGLWALAHMPPPSSSTPLLADLLLPCTPDEIQSPWHGRQGLRTRRKQCLTYFLMPTLSVSAPGLCT